LVHSAKFIFWLFLDDLGHVTSLTDCFEGYIFKGIRKCSQVIEGFMLVILAGWKAEIIRIAVQGQPGEIVRETPIFKINKAKWTGGMASAIDRLLWKLTGLSSNPSLTKAKQNKTQKGLQCGA
jgi:hypothetical protein